MFDSDMVVVVGQRPVVSNSLQPHGLQHPRLPCPSPSHKVCLSSCPLHRWCHSAISSSDTLFSFCPQSFPASGTFPISQLFTSDDENTGVSASVLPMSIQGWFPLRLNGLISLQSKGLSGDWYSNKLSQDTIYFHLSCWEAIQIIIVTIVQHLHWAWDCVYKIFL